MSDYPPSYFLQQSENHQDNPLDPSMFEESNLDYLFADDEALAYPDGPVSDQNAIPEITERNSSGHEKPQGGLTNEDPQLEIDYGDLMREQENISRMLEMVAPNEPSSLADANKSLPIVEEESRYEGEEYQGGLSSFPNTIPENDSANHGQQQVGLPNDQIQGQVEPKAFGEFHEEMKNPQGARYTVTGESSEFPETVADEEQRIQKRLQKAKQTGTSKPKDRRRRPAAQKQSNPAHHTLGPQGDLDTSAAGHDPQTMKKGEGSEVNTPGVDSGYGTLNPSPEAMEPADSGQNINTNDEAVKKVKEIRPEADPNFDPANDLNHYPEDPETGVIESRRRQGWGRTGLKNGVEVWFNPYTEAWVESASHHSYRETLIARAQAEHPDRRYRKYKNPFMPSETDDGYSSSG